MRVKHLLFTIFIGTAFFVDVTLGTSSYPKLLIMACAIVVIYEFISPYVYTPS
jgi:hypothetical protein